MTQKRIVTAMFFCTFLNKTTRSYAIFFQLRYSK
uniref:Uncharacterized protein n=1 Tax=Rhizophora mucronata TaxID=61149 RepID=A0A2P2NNF6_RHIMU